MRVCTYTMKRSPFFWLQWGPHGARKNRSSGVRLDDPEADFKLAKRINKIEATLLVRNTGTGWDWVPAHFRAQHRNSVESLRIHRTAWNWISAYLRMKGIDGPAELTRTHAMDYIEWRMSKKKEKSGRTPKRNTALYELRVLGRVMKEAVLREMTEKNPLADLGLKRDTPEPKPEILPEQQSIILDALRPKPDWMRVPFRIALQSGLRYQETRIDLLRDMNWTDQRITVPDPKGGITRAFTFPIMQDSLTEFLAELRADGRRYTWEMPDRLEKPYALIWRDFFDSLGMQEISFHSTRVTFITWCQRSRIPEAVTMQLVNHASSDVHRVYQRLRAVEVRAWRDHLAPVIPQLAPSASPSAGRASKRGTRAR